MPAYRLVWIFLVYSLGAAGAAIALVTIPWEGAVSVGAVAAMITCMADVAGQGWTRPIGSRKFITAGMVGACAGLALEGLFAFVGLVGLVTALLLVAVSPPAISRYAFGVRVIAEVLAAQQLLPASHSGNGNDGAFRLIRQLVCGPSLVR